MHALQDSLVSESFSSRRQLRQELRRRRRALSPHQRQQADRALCRRLRQLPEVRRARRVALYLPNDGEIDPRPLIPWLNRRSVRVYLPVLKPLSDNRLWFVHYHPGTPMRRNRFGIPEPQTQHGAHRARRLATWALDLILLPLVGFDDQGHRQVLRIVELIPVPFGDERAQLIADVLERKWRSHCRADAKG